MSDVSIWNSEKVGEICILEFTITHILCIGSGSFTRFILSVISPYYHHVTSESDCSVTSCGAE